MSKLSWVVGVATTLTVASPAAAQDIKASIVGIWKLTSHANKNAATGTITHPYGQHPLGYHLFGRSGLLMFSMFAENRKTPVGRTPTEAERAALLQSVVHYNGTYTIEGSRIIVRIDANATPTDVSNRAYIAEMSGNKLSLTAEPFANEAGQQQITIRTFDRIE